MLRLYLPTNEHLWPLGVKKGAPECQKNPEIPNIVTDSCLVKDKLTHRQLSYGLKPAELSAVL